MEKIEIGQKFLDGDRVCTVTDILRTYNENDELVSVKYVATHEFCGQVVTDRNVCETTIARHKVNA